MSPLDYADLEGPTPGQGDPKIRQDWIDSRSAQYVVDRKFFAVSRVYAEMCPVTASVPRAKLGVLDFGRMPAEFRLELLTELRFSLGAHGAAPLEGALDCGKYIPVVVDDRKQILQWLRTRPKPPGVFMVPSLFHSKESYDWVYPDEVKVEQRIANRNFAYQAEFKQRPERERNNGRRP